MAKDKYKEQFAESTASAFRAVYPDAYSLIGDEQVFSEDFVYDNLEQPKDPKMGRFAFPVFRYSKLLGQKPPVIATRVATEIGGILNRNQGPVLVSPSAAGGFVNARVDFISLAGGTLEDILTHKSGYGGSERGKNQHYLIEYSSPNVAKPFGIAHLRTTIIGNALRRIYKKLGFNVVGLNFLGDWGTQFGKMIVAFRKWGNLAMLEENAIENLQSLYVRFHEEVEKDPTLDDQARLAFKELEDGEEAAQKLWQDFSDRSIKEFRRVYDKAGIEFDEWLSESMMNTEMDSVIARIEKDGLARLSDGALIVDLKDPLLPPCLLRKADGATLYSTRDIAGMVYRWNRWKFFESLYVVGSSQSDHFKQVFKVIEMMEAAENLPPAERMTGRVKHIGFGWVKFGEKTFSTRQGRVVYLEDVIDKAAGLVKEIIAEKNPDLPSIDETALMVGVGAVVFSQFSVRRQKDVNFDWDTVLNFDGETGPYLQYTHARLCSLLRNYKGEISPGIDCSLLDRQEELRVIELLADFPAAVDSAARNYEPSFIASHLLRLAAAFNTFYQRKDRQGRIDKIISDDQALTAARIALVKAVQIVLKEGLYLLGIEAPEAM